MSPGQGAHLSLTLLPPFVLPSAPLLPLDSAHIFNVRQGSGHMWGNILIIVASSWVWISLYYNVSPSITFNFAFQQLSIHSYLTIIMRTLNCNIHYPNLKHWWSLRSFTQYYTFGSMGQTLPLRMIIKLCIFENEMTTILSNSENLIFYSPTMYSKRDQS